ncbi:hypothetical protein KUF71_006231 [Frankliniella fusca]|uniref:Reverse transcriptase domain-containing protein n=1 Tax=Frankliniella fusca TaxID=407009 RepID=A0AAE1H7W4_9NEOP|nr:hypothetical protein KUF71_006231 [Frankliniella fusca]
MTPTQVSDGSSQISIQMCGSQGSEQQLSSLSFNNTQPVNSILQQMPSGSQSSNRHPPAQIQNDHLDSAVYQSMSLDDTHISSVMQSPFLSQSANQGHSSSFQKSNQRVFQRVSFADALNSPMTQSPFHSQSKNQANSSPLQLTPTQVSDGSSQISIQMCGSQGSEQQLSSLIGNHTFSGNQSFNNTQPVNSILQQMPSGSQSSNRHPPAQIQLTPTQVSDGSSQISIQMCGSQGSEQQLSSLICNHTFTGNQSFNNTQPLNSNLQQMPSGSQSSNRHPLAQIQIREMRFRVHDLPPSEILPDAKDPNFVVALNSENRVNRLMAEAVSNLKYKYDVRSIIRREGEVAVAIVESLDKGSFVFGYKRNIVVHAVVNHLFSSVRSKALVSTVMRECMAIQIVATWPALKMYLYSQEDRPWHHWYNAEQNMGYLENVTQVTQRTGKKRGSDGIRKSKNPSGTKKPRKLVAGPTQENHDDSDPDEYINYTYERRRIHINVREVETVKTLTEFPHFLHYSGEVIEQEFNLMYEQKQTCFVRVFERDMVPKLKRIAELEPKKYASCTPSGYAILSVKSLCLTDVINAMVILAKMLPTPIRTYIHEEKMPLQPDLNDLFHVIPAGFDPVSHVEHRCVLSEYKLQPYILATGTLQAVRKMFLVVNGKIMELKNSTPAHAIDILVKTFFAFNVHYPLAWKNAPPPVNLKTGNIQKSWDLFKQKFGFYLIAIGKTKASTEVKCALLMGVAGDDALEVYNAFADKLITYKTNEQNEQVIDTDYSNNYDKVVEQFDLYAAEKKCVTGCRELFNARSQRKGESFQTWLTDIQTLVKDCEYAQISDSMLKDRIIWGTYDKKLREAIRAKARLPLDDIIEICKGAANNARYPGQNDQGDTQEVDAVQVFSGKGTKMHPNNFGIPSSGRGGRGTKGYRGRGRGRFQQTQTRNGSKGEGKNGNNSGFNNLFKYKCRKCAKFHEAGNCPAWGQTCGKCGGRNHFKVVCQKASNKPEQAKKVDSIQSVTSQLEGVLLGGWSDNNRYVHMLTVRDTVKRKVIESGWESKRPRKEHTEVLRLQGEHYVKFKLDNGSEVNSLPIHVFEKINKGYKVYPANTLLESYGQVLSKPAGAVELLVETKYGGKLVCEFLLSTVEPKPLLGIEACEKLNLVIKVQHPQDVNSVTVSKFLPESKQDFVKEYMELFTGIGEFQQKVEIVVDPTYQPRMCPARRYHFSIIKKLKPKLDDLERTGVIAKVTDEIPKFVSNMVIREKSNGDLRICLDPEQLNKAILKPRYVIPTFDELACKVKDQEIFTVLDLKWGFWHATLDDKSSMLCTFSTPHGLYRFKKMPFGICSAPETFQFLTEQAFQGKTYAEHDAKLMKFMQRAKEQNIRFNCDKIQYRQKQVKFLGQLLSKNATKVDPERHLEPKVVLVKALLKKLQDKVKAQHDLRARRKPVTFQQGDDVVVRRGKKWQKGKIVRRLSENRSYVINLLGGGQLRRNTWHIKHSKTKPDRVDAGGSQVVLDAEEMLANLKANDSLIQ